MFSHAGDSRSGGALAAVEKHVFSLAVEYRAADVMRCPKVTRARRGAVPPGKDEGKPVRPGEGQNGAEGIESG